MKIQVTAQQRANAIEARDVMWPSVPPKNVATRLGYWSNQPSMPSCRTHACFGGWCAVWPAFRDQGVRASITGAPTISGRPPSGVADQLFGFSRLFAERGHDDLDRQFTGTDHELVTHRLNWLINNSEVIA